MELCVSQGHDQGYVGSYNVLSHKTKPKELTKAGGRFLPTYSHTYNQVNEPHVNFLSIPMTRSSGSQNVTIICLYLKVGFRRLKN